MEGLLQAAACVHDEIVIECDEGKANKAEAWVKEAMVDGMDEVFNGPRAEEPRMPVEVERQIAKTWAR
jgi:DNA polymerase I-like protein with 3'-5' exonuclease and polymerase domains